MARFSVLLTVVVSFAVGVPVAVVADSRVPAAAPHAAAHVRQAPDLPPGGTFVDDDGSPFEPSIEAIAAAGITRGCNPPRNDRFCPAGEVTRGEMAAFINRARRLPAAPPGNRFVDDDGSVFEDDIERLAAAGITRGCNPPRNDRFCPDVSISRGEMAAMLVRTYGYDHPGGGDRFVDDDGSVFEDDIERLAGAGVTKGCNPPANDRFCPTSPVRRDQMAAFLQRAEGLDPIYPPPPAVPTLTTVVDGLASPVHVAAPDGDGRIFIVEKGGTIRIVTASGTLRTQPFLNISYRVTDSGERGLLGLAFHPGYAGNGRFFVAYSSPLQPQNCSPTDTACHTTIIAEYRVSADPNIATPSGEVILRIPQPFANHNGGHLEFGPDGRLYIGVGDGGGSNDPRNGAQTVTNLLGSVLRIDVDGPGTYTSPSDNPFVGVNGRDEIWVYGLRNPWRFAFSGNSIYIGDVGQGAWEEINVVNAPGAAGANFGWRMFEGDVCTGNGPGCSRSGLVFPAHTYSHDKGCSITGGRVYRGTEISRLTGHYLYGDFCTGTIWSLRMAGGQATDHTDWTPELGTVSSLASFGEGGDGTLYVVSLAGTVYRLEAK